MWCRWWGSNASQQDFKCGGNCAAMSQLPHVLTRLFPTLKIFNLLFLCCFLSSFQDCDTTGYPLDPEAGAGDSGRR
jgi:hypothetical protein